MVPLVWDERNRAVLEFCQSEGGVFGYRLPETTSCGPAGVVLRLRPGSNYTLMLRNDSMEPTNLHFHGLHAMADDIERSIAPGRCGLYHLNIHQDHVGGTFWMHSHQHPLTDRQVSGGAYAMLIVEENPRLLEHIVDHEDRRNLAHWLRPANELFLLVSKSLSEGSLANGKVGHTLVIDSDRWYRLRVASVHASGKRAALVLPSACQAHILAYDGIWRRTVPHPDITREHLLSGSSRLDLAFRCHLVGNEDVLFGNEKVATVSIQNVAGANPAYDVSPFLPNQQTWRPWKPAYLQDMTEYETSAVHSFTARALKDGVNGRQFDPQVPLLQIESGSLQEWKLKYTNWHPFHLHTFPVQTFGCQGHEDGEFYDTIMSSDDVCTVRFRAIDFMGNILFHCHVLAHSDAGSMAYVQVHGENYTVDAFARDKGNDKSQTECTFVLP